ncbi:MAG: phosphoribosyltransferase family protein [Eubacteriales bacterium]|nr:phosphoribosyltransferase family protein [Eubacteriales bacterium]
MKLNDELNRVSRGILDFFFPRRCPFCGAPAGKDLLCEKCRHSLPFTDEHALQTGTFGNCSAPLYYEDRVRDAILQFKFKGKLGGLSCFGMLMAQCAAEQYSGAFDAITWVPVSKKRLKKRGYDQTRYLTAALCVDWHVAPIETLRKVVDNPPQSSRESAEQRRANVLGVYEAVNTEQFCGKRLLLVDDILTTGATLSECVRVLKEAGAAEVMCLTLAMSREKK